MVENQKLKNKLFFYFLLIFFIFCLAFNSASFAKELNVEHKEGLYLIKINLSDFIIEPYVVDSLETVDNIGNKTGALAIINAGFFDGVNGETISFIKKNGTVLANPKNNKRLINNLELAPYLDKIFNRAELRILNCNEKIIADITFRNSPLKKKCKLLSSTQAGPMLLPKMNLEKEFFILKKDKNIIRDSIGVYRKASRSAIGITKNDIYFVITDKNNPLTIFELQTKFKKIGFQKALALDGGGSTSLYLKTDNGIFYQAREKNNTSRKVKSVLLVKNK